MSVSVRTASFRDLARIEEIQHEGGGELSETASRGPIRLWSLVSQTLSAILPALYSETLLYVAEEDGTVIGFVQASNRPAAIGLVGATTLQVLNLCIDPGRDEEEAGRLLIEHLTDQALERGILRLFVRLPLEDPLTSVFRRQGFRQYAVENVLYTEKPGGGPGDELAGLRAERGRDHALVYQLYRKLTPSGIATIEAPTYKEWRSLQGEWFGHHPIRGESDDQFVVDRVEIVGWLRVQRSSSTRPHTLSFMALPEDHLPAELADHALGLLGPRPGAVWSSLRHYDSHMIEALRARGFETLVNQSLMVKELALRVPAREKGMVPSFG
ncbi:MAG TPA: GNAT family N-acetyltransferase [Candidatus Dormibacteraeota bacterium]|nr:GNAT family N-acetyltransferase [Candidatus Dormibacteraeota bacterium]